MTNLLIPRKEAKEQGLKYYFTGKPCKMGHISKRFVNNCACVECSYIRRVEWGNINQEHIRQQSKEYYYNNLDFYKQYYIINIEQFKKNDIKYKLKNKEHISKREKDYRKIHLEQSKQYRLDNKEHILEQNKDYRLRNKHKTLIWAASSRKRRVKQNKAYEKQYRANNPHKRLKQSKLRTTRLEQQIPSWYEEDLIKQLYLKRDELNELWGTNFQVDHIIPLNPKCGTVSGLHCWANLQLLDGTLNRIKGSNYETDW